MSRWVILFLIISIISGVLGFTDIASASTAGMAKVIFYFFITFFAISLAIKTTEIK